MSAIYAAALGLPNTQVDTVESDQVLLQTVYEVTLASLHSSLQQVDVPTAKPGLLFKQIADQLALVAHVVHLCFQVRMLHVCLQLQAADEPHLAPHP